MLWGAMELRTIEQGWAAELDSCSMCKREYSWKSDRDQRRARFKSAGLWSFFGSVLGVSDFLRFGEVLANALDSHHGPR